MKWKLVIMSVILLLGIGGAVIVVQAMNGEKSPAMKDRFTRGFLTNEANEEGYYQFNSKTGQYTMLFPEHFVMVSDTKEFYGIQGNDFEIWNGILDKDYETNGVSNQLRTHFEILEVHRHDTRKLMMLDESAYNGEHEVLELDNKIVYYGKSNKFVDREENKVLTRDADKYGATRYFAFVIENGGERMLELTYFNLCKERYIMVVL